MEVNNAAAIREASERLSALVKHWIDHLTPVVRQEVSDSLEELDAALSAPARQCDVGTAEEQTARYRKFCSDHKFLGSDSSYMCKGFGKGRCPFFNSNTKSQCEFEWAQAPYEEGGAK